jgi:hypothetical protein
MVYEVRVSGLDGSERRRFELERADALSEGDTISQALGALIYQVVRVLPDKSGQFDAIVEARAAGGL